MNKQKILLVDDEPQNLQLLRQILKDDYELVFAKSGEDALKQVLSHHPDLILLDVMMAGMDGHEVCRRIKADNRSNRIPVIFITAMVDEDDEAKGFELGAVDYITKPIRPSVVKVRVRTHLALSDQQRACQQRVEQQHEALLNTRLHSLQMLGKAAEFKDNETGLHVLRMSNYSHLLAQAYGWNEEACTLMLHAAPMHDIGKIGTPDRILGKPAKLDQDEWIIMKQHAEIGAQIIGDYAKGSDLFEMARIIALTHHEKWNGTGYPHGLSGENIPVAGRIVAIADVFDALTSQRPYKAAWPIERAVALLKEEAGQHFDPVLVELFIGILPEVVEIHERWLE
ncbi:HD domain-containing phosphohydrolase [Sulfuriferula thiophila]|uniref:HD domain-containing phosphohydrolase n=1 Tax=Sulfuriferula thiophila TaxID=1781211 RepID=UPI000F60E612|nr:HD domain-containing phosphohydrolase [Sulfuriferula thiophila]